MSVEELVRSSIVRYNMLSADDKVLVGFSGGSDSVCLLSLLYEMGYDVMAAHLNHNMRDTALRDLKFCESFCRERNIPFVSKTAEKGKLKSEADAREARYRFFAEVMEKHSIDRLATAHNKNDSAETVLLHLLRGASTDGLCGISPADKNVIRPLIFVKKSEIVGYCENNGLSYVTDETNFQDKYTRNKLRNRYMPMLCEEFNPRLTDTLADNAVVMSYDRDFLLKTAKKAYDDIKIKSGIDLRMFLELDRAIGSRVIELMWKDTVEGGQNLPQKYVDDIYLLAKRQQSGKSIDLPKSVIARIEYGVLYLEKKSADTSYEAKFEIGKWCDLPETDSKIGIFETGKGLKLSFDGDEKLLVRTRKTGDKFCPAGLGGSKSISDFFTDSKIPAAERDRLPLLIADGKIAAVADIRADDDFAGGKRKKNYVLIIAKK